MTKIAKPLQDDEAVEPIDDDGNTMEFADAEDNSLKESKKVQSGFTPTRRVSWPWGSAKPPQEPESDQAATARTRSDAAQVDRVLANREEAEKARRDDHRHDPGGSIEAKWASGHTKVAGKHVANPGLLQRGGKAKILPESNNREEIECDLEMLREVANQVLHGRNGTIFNRHVIEPLGDGKRHPPVSDTAAQFNVEEPRVYKIMDKCWQKIREAVPRFLAGRPLTGEDRSPTCSICGRPDSSTAM